MSKRETTPWGTDEAAFDAQLHEARDRSIANLRQAAEPRCVELLARNIHARLKGESQADAMLAITKVLGVWLRSMPLNEQITGIAIIASLVAQEITGGDAP